MKNRLFKNARGCFAIAAGILCSAMVQTAAAQAPASIAGNSFFVQIENGTGSFSSSGFGLLMLANTGNNYNFESVSGLSASSGTETYAQSNTDGFISVVDNHVGSFTGDFTFTDASEGTFAFNQSSSGSTQSGEFKFCGGHAPTSLAGKTFQLGIFGSSGGNSGTYDVAFTANGFSVITPVSTNSGSYTYSLVDQSTGKIVATGTHPNTIFVGFTDSNNGFYASTNTLGQYEIGSFSSPDTQAPTNQITSPTANQSVSNADFTVTGKASDNDGVAAVYYQLNFGTWFLAGTTNGYTNWSAGVELHPGTNIVSSYAIDASNNVSFTQSVLFVYVVSAPLTVDVVGSGTVTPNYNGSMLAIDKNYSMTAKAATGFKFAGWTGSLNTTNTVLNFTMASNLTFTATFVDAIAPTLVITKPTANLNVSNVDYLAFGTSADNVSVASVHYQINGGSWFLAGTSNNFANWNAGLELTPGTNVFKAFATDAAGNNSTTQSVTFVYVLSAVLMVQTNGHGTVSPNLNNALLQIGKSFTMKATASTGFKFVNWTGSTNTTNSTLTFTMASNLDFTANFADATAPTVVVTKPTANLNVSNAAYNITGTAKDNVGVTSVTYQLNTNDWAAATLSNGGSNWNAAVQLTPGTNHLKVFASDAAGNNSLTQNVAFVYVLSAVVTVETNGHGTVTPNLNNALLQIGKSFTMKAIASTGFKFTGWTGSTNTTNSSLSFTMASNLDFTANFADATAPKVTLISPKANVTVTNIQLQITGTASDNVAVSNVYYRLSGGPSFPAHTSNNWSNWTATVVLGLGTNVIQFQGVDTSGLLSPIVSLTIVRSPFAQVFPLISGTVGMDHPQAQIAFDGDNYLVGYQAHPNGASNSPADLGQFVSTSGQLVGGVVDPQLSGDAPNVAFDGDNYLMADVTFQQSGAYIEGAFITKNGTTGTPGQITQSTSVDNFGTMVFGGGVYLLVWADGQNSATNGGHDDIYGAMVAPDGSIVASDFLIGTLGNENEAGQGSASFDGSNFLVTWGGVVGQTSISGRLIDPTGNFVTDPFVIYTNNAVAASKESLCSVTFNGTNYLVLFNVGVQSQAATSWHILGRLVSTSGPVLTNQITLTSDAGPQLVGCSAFDGSNFLITWNQGFNPLTTTTPGTVMARFFNPNGVPTGPEFKLFTPPTGETALWAPVLFDGSQFFTVGGIGKEVTASPDMKFTNSVISGAIINP